jgi:hypothetical protein
VWTALQALLHLIAALPRVENPWPRSVGLELPFSAAGAGGVIGNVFWARRSAPERDRATSIGGLLGFGAGALAYLALFANQVLLCGMKLSVSKETRQAMIMGAVLGTVCAILDASAAVIYAVTITAVGILIWIHLGPPEGHPLRYLRRRW